MRGATRRPSKLWPRVLCARISGHTPSPPPPPSHNCLAPCRHRSLLPYPLRPSCVSSQVRGALFSRLTPPMGSAGQSELYPSQGAQLLHATMSGSCCPRHHWVHRELHRLDLVDAPPLTATRVPGSRTLHMPNSSPLRIMRLACRCSARVPKTFWQSLLRIAERFSHSHAARKCRNAPWLASPWPFHSAILAQPGALTAKKLSGCAIAVSTRTRAYTKVAQAEQ